MNFPPGFKRTKPRELVLALLDQIDKPLTVGELERLLKGQGSPLWVSTLYRVLEDLERAGLVQKTENPLVEGALFFRKRSDHQHFALCKCCGGATPLVSCPFALLEEQLGREGFLVETHEIQLVGLCAACKKK